MPEKFYRVGPLRRWIRFLILVPIAVTVVGMAWFNPGASIALALVTLPFVGLGLWAIAMARLEITPQGVNLRQLGFRLSTHWDNVESLYSVRGREGIVTIEPMVGAGVEKLRRTRGFSLSGMPQYDSNQQQWLAEGRFIPIDAFGYWLRKGDLLKSINLRITNDKTS